MAESAGTYDAAPIAPPGRLAMSVRPTISPIATARTTTVAAPGMSQRGRGAGVMDGVPPVGSGSGAWAGTESEITIPSCGGSPDQDPPADSIGPRPIGA